MESRLRVTKGACPPPLLRSVDLRLFRGCRKACCGVEGALGCLPSWVWCARNISLDLGLLWGMEHKWLPITLIYNSRRLLQPCLFSDWSGFSYPFWIAEWLTLFFFLIGSTNCHSSHSFCFVFTELLHDSSSVTLLNKHFIKPRINCLFFWIRVLEHPMSGWVLFFVFQLATEALYRATNICSSLNLKPLFFFNCRFSPDFAIVLICCIFFLDLCKNIQFWIFCDAS